MQKRATTLAKHTLLVLIVAVLLIQAVPYGHDHANPPTVREPAWDSPATRALAKRACFDCHSNETVWPWYTWVAPVSWLISRDVSEGRRELNFTEWQGGRREGEKASEIREQIEKGEMPPIPYRLMHAEARLTAEEKRQLINGLHATVVKSGL